MFLLKSHSSSSIESAPGDYQRCNEVFPEAQRQVSCETMMTDTAGRYLVIPSSYAATIAAASGTAAMAAVGSAASSSGPASGGASSFPFVLCVYSAHPVLIKRRPAWIPALTIATHLATIRGDSKQLSEVGGMHMPTQRVSVRRCDLSC